MKARYWSLAIVLLLINYLIFALLFNELMVADFDGAYATRTPVPTFTPAPVQPFIIVPTPTPVPVIPTPTPTLVVSDDNAESSLPSSWQNNNTTAATQPELVAPGSVNIRSGPSLSFDVIGTLATNSPRSIVGRDGDWWQIKLTDSELGWVSSSVVQADNVAAVPLVQGPALPVAPVPAAQPASNSAPAPEKPKFQYSPTGWYDDTNAGITRFMGDIKDAGGNPVNGVFVRASCGHYATISFPSGPVGWGTRNDGADWPAGAQNRQAVRLHRS